MVSIAELQYVICRLFFLIERSKKKKGGGKEKRRENKEIKTGVKTKRGAQTQARTHGMCDGPDA